MDFVLRHDTVLAFIKLHLNHDYSVSNIYVESFLESLRLSTIYGVDVNDELTATEIEVQLPLEMVVRFLERKQESAKRAWCDGKVLTLMPQATLYAPLKKIEAAFVKESFVVFRVTEKTQADLEAEAIAAGAFIDSEEVKRRKREARAKQ